MAGQLNLRHHGDAARGGVGHHPPHFVLRVVAAVRHGVRAVAVVGQGGGGAAGAHLREPRPGAYLQAPTLIVGQVPVKGVELVERHQIKEPLDERDGKEVARHVEMQAAPREARVVADGYRRQRRARRPRRLRRGRGEVQQLA